MLTWNVYVENINAMRIETFNIFDHASFAKDCKDTAAKFAADRSGFEKAIRSGLMYWFWCKCEWEVVICSLICGDRVPPVKIDVYAQVMQNWPVFIDWLWQNKDLL